MTVVYTHLIASTSSSCDDDNGCAESPSAACNFSALAARFPRQPPQLWRRLQLGVDAVRRDRVPQQACFLLVRSGCDDSSNADADDDDGPEDIAVRIAAEAHRCLRSEAASPSDGGSFVRLRPADFNAYAAADGAADYGRLLAAVAPRLAAARVLLVDDVQAVHAAAARSLHFLCDSVSPPCDRSVVVLTMRPTPTTTRCAAEQTVERVGVETVSLLASVERQLGAAWAELHGDVLGPLLTRVTDQVLRLE